MLFAIFCIAHWQVHSTVRNYGNSILGIIFRKLRQLKLIKVRKADKKEGAVWLFLIACSLTFTVNVMNHPGKSVFAEGLTFRMIPLMESETCNYVSRFSAAMKRGSSLRCEPLAITQLVAAIIVLGRATCSRKVPKAP